MASPQIRQDHSWQLQQLAAAWNVSSLPPVPASNLPSPSSPHATTRTLNDDLVAEELLKSRRQDAQDRDSRGGLRRAFASSKKKDWAPHEVLKALEEVIQDHGSPGVAEALIAKLNSAGGDLNVFNTTRNRSSILLPRRKSLEFSERSQVLEKAVRNRHPEMVAMLVQHADPMSLDGALPLAISAADVATAELLVRYDAKVCNTADGQDAFRKLCIDGGQADLVSLVLQSEGRPSPSWISQCMVDAAQRGCLDTVLRLSRSTADGNFNNAQALKEAVSQSRVDIALAILTGTKPPSGPAINEVFAVLFSRSSILPNEKLALSQALLCSGASGNAVGEALKQASAAEFYEMVEMLVSYGASIEYQDAAALRTAISEGQTRLILMLLSEKAVLNKECASQCVSHIPKKISPEDRHLLLTALLRKGASGPPIHDALIDAVEAGDKESVSLLLAPFFPTTRRTSDIEEAGKDSRRASRDRHSTASVDHRGGLALQIAVSAGDRNTARRLLAAKPTSETLTAVFAEIRNLGSADRYQMTECFLSTGLSGPCVSQALQDALDENPGRRDDNLIGLLLRHNADVNFNGGAGVLSAVAQQDPRLLETLLRNRPSAQVASAGVTKAMDANDRQKREEMVSLLIGAGASPGSQDISAALAKVLQDGPVDIRLLNLLLDQGKADVNFMQGAPIVSGT